MEGGSTRMTIARSDGEEKSRSAFTHIGDRDSSDGPLSGTPLLLLSVAALQMLSCNSSLIHPPHPLPTDFLVGLLLLVKLRC